MTGSSLSYYKLPYPNNRTSPQYQGPLQCEQVDRSYRVRGRRAPCGRSLMPAYTQGTTYQESNRRIGNRLATRGP